MPTPGGQNPLFANWPLSLPHNHGWELLDAQFAIKGDMKVVYMWYIIHIHLMNALEAEGSREVVCQPRYASMGSPRTMPTLRCHATKAWRVYRISLHPLMQWRQTLYAQWSASQGLSNQLLCEALKPRGAKWEHFLKWFLDFFSANGHFAYA